VMEGMEGLEDELLDTDTDGGGATGEMRRGIGVPFENGFVAIGVGVGRGNEKVITMPGNCRSIIINCVVAPRRLPVVLGEGLSAITPGNTRKALRRINIARRRDPCGILPIDLEYPLRRLPCKLPSQLGFPHKGQTSRGLDYQT